MNNKSSSWTNKQYQNLAISFDWTLEKAKELLVWVENDIINRLEGLKNRDFTLYNLFVIVINKLVDKYWNNIKKTYNNFENELSNIFLLNDKELEEFKNTVFGNIETTVANSTKLQVANALWK